jgi:hypothetical protein
MGTDVRVLAAVLRAGLAAGLPVSDLPLDGDGLRTLLDARTRLAGLVAAVLDVCDRAEFAARRWEEPLPVPEWVDTIRAAVRTGMDPAAARRNQAAVGATNQPVWAQICARRVQLNIEIAAAASRLDASAAVPAWSGEDR